MSFRVRRPRPAEATALRMLLPEVPAWGPEPEFRIAVADGSRSILGAAVMVPRPSGRSPAGFRLAVEVPPPWRRQGVGRALVENLAGEAQRYGARAVRAWGAVAEDSGEAAFLAALDFYPVRRIFRFTADFAPILESVRRLRKRLEAARKIPPDARLVTLEAAPPESVLRLYMQEIGGERSQVARQLNGLGAEAWSRDLSTVLMLGREVCGAVLLSLDGDTLHVDAFIVDARHRDRWAPAVLLAEAGERAVAAGARYARFLCADDARDTLKFARRCAAEPQRVDLLFARRLASVAWPLSQPGRRG